MAHHLLHDGGMRIWLLTISLAASLVVISSVESSSAEAQYRYRRARPGATVVVFPRGLYVGGGVVGTAILDQSGGPEILEGGAGVTLYGGMRIGRLLALELGFLGSFHNPATVDVGFGPETDYLVLSGATADAKIYLMSGSYQQGIRPAGEPFIQGGLGVYTLASENLGTDSIGTGFQLGGGYEFHIGRALDLGVRGLYRGIAMGPPDSSFNDTFISALTVEGNLTIRFW